MPKMDKGERCEKLRTLCQKIVADPRSVDGGTAGALRTAALKYARTVYDDPVPVLQGLYQSDGELGSLLRKAVAVVTKQLDDQEISPSTQAAYPRNRWYLDLLRDPNDIDEQEDDDDDDDDDDAVGKQHYASTVANLLVEAGSHPDRASALHHLLREPSGRALLASLRKAAEQTEKDHPPMDSILQIMKSGGIARTCAAIVAKGETSISEHALVEAATAVAAERHPGLSASAAFAKVYADQGDEGRVLREAVHVAKVSQWLAGGSTVDAKTDTRAGTAYGELMSKAEEYRSAHPELSVAQCFEKIYTAPANVALRKRERQESAPR
jgi:hypothetical protein